MKQFRWAVSLFSAIFMVSVFILLAGCATKYEMKINADGTGSWKSSSTREAKRVITKFTKDGEKIMFYLEAHGVTDDTAEAAVAITSDVTDLAADTGDIWLKGGRLVDSLGNPRSATEAEIMAQLEAKARRGKSDGF